mmetsp:Transcript_40724/g.95649  ORF Transcript_40724/g.95649 Transcript_40724/m.95649 type:complete len:100 (-) Transcript_40724:902-1201(-)
MRGNGALAPVSPSPRPSQLGSVMSVDAAERSSIFARRLTTSLMEELRQLYGIWELIPVLLLAWWHCGLPRASALSRDAWRILSIHGADCPPEIHAAHSV